MSITEKAATASTNNVIIAENEQKVYNSGVAEGNYQMRLLTTKAVSNNGKRTNYYSAFLGSNFDFIDNTFADGYIAPVSAERMFYDYKGTLLPKGIDFSNVTNANAMCCWSSTLKVLPDIGLQAGINIDYLVQYCSSMETIEVLRLNEDRPMYAWGFIGCTSLKNLTIEGTIIGNLALNESPLLTHKSLMSVITALKDYSADTSGTAHTLTLGSTNLSKLTEQEQQIAIDKGWRLA